MKKVVLICLCLTFSFISYSQKKIAQPTTRILFIFDCSRSMIGEWESGKKIDVARKIFSRVLDSLNKIENLQLALRMYGHQSQVPPQDCNDTKLEIPFAYNNSTKIKQKILTTEPKGTTPIAKSLEKCAADFTPCDNCRNIIILITDGIEECGGDPCKIAIALQSKGIVLKPFVIGIGLDVKAKKMFECIGNYYDADNEDKFDKFFTQIITKVSGVTTAQVNLNDIYGKPTESNVNMTVYNQDNGVMIDNMIHTLNRLGNPDTFYLDPIITYKIVVHTIPPISIQNITIKPKIHNIIKTDAPQGYLQITVEGGKHYRNLKFIVRQNKKSETLYAQEFYTKEKYLVGKYDLELLTLPRIYFEDVEISQGKVTSLEITMPGLVNLTMPDFGYGSLYKKQKGGIEWVCNLNDIKKESLLLQPGEYMAIQRPKNAPAMSFSVTRTFKVESGRSVNVNFMP